MRYLEKLLKGAKVEWKTLGEVAVIFGGLKGKSKDDFLDGNAKFVSYKNIFYNIEVDFDALEDVKVLPEENQYELQYGDVLFTGSSEIANESGMSSAVTSHTKFKVYLNSFSFGLRFNPDTIIIPEFSKYLFRSIFMRNAIAKTANGVTRYNISKKNFAKLEIPIPSLSVQKEIVRILDTFTQVSAELSAELSARKKQYDYYREQLLTFDEGKVEWKTLGEVASKISSGGTPSTSISEYYNGNIPWLRTQEVDFVDIWDTGIKITELGLKNSSAKMIPANCVIVAMYGATVGKIGINKIPLSTNQACANIQVNENIANYRYVFYYLCSKYEHIKSLGSGSQTNINAKIVKDYKIPIPPLSEQERIVSILDKFDTLTTSISEGLPREIEQRKQQYEYYREMLLTFPKEEQ